MLTTSRTVGDHLRDWRTRRRLSQLAFALDADISQKHLSFIESGRTKPSREMVLRLAARLDVPLRERNAILLAAGYAPVYAERRLDDPALSAARAAIDLVLKGHEPYPALAVDRHWNLVAANEAAGVFLAMVTDSRLLEPPVNVLRASLAPGGLAPQIENLAEWRHHVIERLRHQVALTGEPTLTALLTELRAYPEPEPPPKHGVPDYGGVLIPLGLRTPHGVLSFFSTITVFGTPTDVTLSELAIEAFFPADDATATAVRYGAGRQSFSRQAL